MPLSINQILFFLGITWILSCVNAQDPGRQNYRLVGGPCEGCEAVFEFEDQDLNHTDTLPDFESGGLKIKITGTVYMKDGKTPAEGVVLYIYHTDQAGVYSTKGGESGWAKRHGYNRTWIKTNSAGRYTFYTIKPGVYPDRTEPAHIHITILEPNGKYYWIDSFLFEGDSLLTRDAMNSDTPRGGSGLLSLVNRGEILTGTRKIVLGKHIPGYE